jgi:hypothetical protein
LLDYATLAFGVFCLALGLFPLSLLTFDYLLSRFYAVFKVLSLEKSPAVEFSFDAESHSIFEL